MLRFSFLKFPLKYLLKYFFDRVASGIKVGTSAWPLRRCTRPQPLSPGELPGMPLNVGLSKPTSPQLPPIESRLLCCLVLFMLLINASLYHLHSFFYFLTFLIKKLLRK